MKAKNIEWDLDRESVYEAIDEAGAVVAAEILGITSEKYESISVDKRFFYLDYVLSDCTSRLYDFLKLPTEESIDTGIAEEDVVDYLTHEYGYCIKNLNIVNEVKLGTFTIDVTMQEDGKFDVYLAHEGSSGEHYKDVSADKIGELIAGDIECIAEAYQN